MSLSGNDDRNRQEEISEEPTTQCCGAAEILRQKTHELGERIKELNCLYGISELVENSGTRQEEILQGTANLIPASWQYPEATCARITVEGRVYQTDGFQETVWRQMAEIKKHGSSVGSVEVFYLEKKPDFSEGPFLSEERSLINAIAERLGHILERLQAEAELRAYRDKMFRAEQLASLGTIGSTLAHQLNQPLTVIRMSTQKVLRNLQDADCPEIVPELLTDSLDQVDQASLVVKRFLALGRVHPAQQNEMICVHSIVGKIISVFREMTCETEVELVVDDSLKGLPDIRGVPGEIEQICFILAQNAVQAASPDKRQWFRISGRIVEAGIELAFSDNCGGIESERLQLIFEPFYTTKDANHGTGLGLAILEQIVERCRGHVRVESLLGLGTSFYVTLPTRQQ